MAALDEDNTLYGLGILLCDEVAGIGGIDVDDALDSEEEFTSQSSPKLDVLNEIPKDDAYTNSQAEGNKNISDKENKVESKSEKNNNSKDFIEKKD